MGGGGALLIGGLGRESSLTGDPGAGSWVVRAVTIVAVELVAEIMDEGLWDENINIRVSEAF